MSDIQLVFWHEVTAYSILYALPMSLPLLAHMTSFLGLFYSKPEHFLSRCSSALSSPTSRSLYCNLDFTLQSFVMACLGIWLYYTFPGLPSFSWEPLCKTQSLHNFCIMNTCKTCITFCSQFEKYPDAFSPRLQQPLSAWVSETRKFYVHDPSPAECPGTLPAQSLTFQLSLHF